MQQPPQRAVSLGTPVLPVLIDETDEYTNTVAGVTVEAVRIGQGVGPNTVLGVPADEVTVTSSKIGFPISTRGHIGEDRIAVTVMREVASDSRWCGLPLEAGSVVVYGPGTDHTAVNRPGLFFEFAATEFARVEEAADQRATAIELPGHAEMKVISASDRTRAYESTLTAYTDRARAGRLTPNAQDDVLQAIVSVLEDPDARLVRRGRGLDSREIVQACIELADSVGRVPSISELCATAHVSERRLREAFTDEFDEAPSRWFRSWALDRVRRRLREADPFGTTVTEVAADVGFSHLGRFAGHYRDLFGESPSATLRSETA